MPTPSSSASYKLRSLITVLYRYRLCSANLPDHQGQYRYVSLSQSKYGYGCSMPEGLRFISTNRRINGKPAQTDMLNNDKDMVQPPVPPPAPPRPSFNSWAKWLLGFILTLLLPFWKVKWEGLLTLEGEVEKVVEEVEIVAEVVEKVATTTEKISAEIADKLSDNDKLKEAALFVEHISTVTAKDAQLTTDFIQKVVMI
ncbi:hypothetical protein F0562_020419 [Nyssa sinensis]|uniref:Uncharacterized protein n=1 Tax=Nyssa sinensis TaxID=561372 RepID=A0A5J5BRN3_9ASTE|nr:hypothetical protein F0562_020419 [Nyssa sinensis]